MSGTPKLAMTVDQRDRIVGVLEEVAREMGLAAQHGDADVCAMVTFSNGYCRPLTLTITPGEFGPVCAEAQPCA